MKLLVCGTQTIHSYRGIVWCEIDKYDKKDLIIIEGQCPSSADQWAEEKAKFDKIPFLPFPGEKGTFLKRNIEMVEACDEVLCFYDGWSYGSAHVCANALLRNKVVKMIGVGKYGTAKR